MNGMLTLEDVLKLPDEIRPEHLQALGLLAPAAPAPVTSMVPPAKVTAPLSPVAAPIAHPAGSVAPMRKPIVPEHEPLTPMAAPEFAAPAEVTAASVPSAPGPIGPEGPNLTFKEKMALPSTSQAVPAGSANYWQGQLERDIEAKEHPWGSPENHPGLLGKIGHVAARIGNIAGNIVAPATMSLIPGTELNKQGKEQEAVGELSEAQKRETAKQHEENISDTNEQKIRQAQEKIDETETLHKSQREIALRKQGLKINPDDPTGMPIPLTVDDMSETEKDVHTLKAAQADSASARAIVERLKADPNSPQNQALRTQLKLRAQAVANAARRVGLDEKKYVADYMGTDMDGNPLPGVQVTPEGKPIGPKIAGKAQAALKEFNQHYIVPAEGVEKSYQMMDGAYKAYQAAKAKGEELPTGAESMLALSTHLTTTFGNVKGARITKDMIEHHLHARSISDDALVAIQRLTNGDVLSPGQWEAFHKLISDSRKLSWKTAVKEGKRANLPVDFLPEDLQGELGVKGKEAAPTEKPKEPPRAPGPGMKWQQSKKTGEFREVPIG
jgi:hypothetical protein